MIPQEHFGWCEEHSAIVAIPSNLDEIFAHYWFPWSRIRKNLYVEFHSLARTWRNDVTLTSSITEMVMHPAYQRIIGMGFIVLPLIFRDLENEPDHWFWALKAITGEDPVKPEDRGNLPKMAAAWLKWAKDQGLEW
jgi:hypothetical protein